MIGVVDGEIILSEAVWEILRNHSGYCREHVNNMRQVPKGHGIRHNYIDLSGFSVDKRLLFALIGDGRIPRYYDLLLVAQIASMLQLNGEFLCYLLRYHYHEDNITHGNFIPTLYHMIHKESQLQNAAAYVLNVLEIEPDRVLWLQQFPVYRDFRYRMRNMLRSNDRFARLHNRQPCKYTRILAKCKCGRCLKAWQKHDFTHIQAELEEYRNGYPLTRMVVENPHSVCPVCQPENAKHVLFTVQEEGFPRCTRPQQGFLGP